MTRTITIGASYAAGASMVSPYSDGGFEPGETTTSIIGGRAHDYKTFTNTSGSDRTVREVQFNDGYITYDRVVLDINAFPNFCIVPDGASLTIECITIAYETTAVIATMDTGAFTNDAPIHYNGVPIPNGQILSISPALGGSAWEIQGYTENKDELDALNVYAGPIVVGTSITGQQYVRSAFLAGTLFIKDLTTHSHVSNSKCYVQAPIDITPMLLSAGGMGYWFTIRIIQSAYGDQ